VVVTSCEATHSPLAQSDGGGSPVSGLVCVNALDVRAGTAEALLVSGAVDGSLLLWAATSPAADARLALADPRARPADPNPAFHLHALARLLPAEALPVYGLAPSVGDGGAMVACLRLQERPLRFSIGVNVRSSAVLSLCTRPLQQHAPRPARAHPALPASALAAGTAWGGGTAVAWTRVSGLRTHTRMRRQPAAQSQALQLPRQQHQHQQPVQLLLPAAAPIRAPEAARNAAASALARACLLAEEVAATVQHRSPSLCGLALLVYSHAAARTHGLQAPQPNGVAAAAAAACGFPGPQGSAPPSALEVAGMAAAAAEVAVSIVEGVLAMHEQTLGAQTLAQPAGAAGAAAPPEGRTGRPHGAQRLRDCLCLQLLQCVHTQARAAIELSDAGPTTAAARGKATQTHAQQSRERHGAAVWDADLKRALRALTLRVLVLVGEAVLGRYTLAANASAEGPAAAPASAAAAASGADQAELRAWSAMVVADSNCRAVALGWADWACRLLEFTTNQPPRAGAGASAVPARPAARAPGSAPSLADSRVDVRALLELATAVRAHCRNRGSEEGRGGAPLVAGGAAGQPSAPRDSTASMLVPSSCPDELLSGWVEGGSAATRRAARCAATMRAVVSPRCWHCRVCRRKVSGWEEEGASLRWLLACAQQATCPLCGSRCVRLFA
jgi:hypothetical protein